MLRIQALRCIASGKWKPGLSRQQAHSWPENAVAPRWPSGAEQWQQQQAMVQPWKQPAAAPSSALVAEQGQQQQHAVRQSGLLEPAPSGFGAGILRPYAGHCRVAARSAPPGMFCLKCGSSPAKGPAQQRWSSEPCAGEKVLPRSYREFLAFMPEGHWAQWPQAWKAWRLRVV